MKALGVMRGPDDPWRILGVARSAEMREIKKKVRELSLVRRRLPASWLDAPVLCALLMRPRVALRGVPVRTCNYSGV